MATLDFKETKSPLASKLDVSTPVACSKSLFAG